jgi:hypothetical protein
VATEVAVGLVHRLLTSSDPKVVELRRTRTFYVQPNASPDATERHLTTPVWMRDVTGRPWDDDGDGIADNDPPRDLDGDGQALRMRQQHPAGEWVKDERDPRLMRRRQPGDTGPFYKLHVEGIDSNSSGRIASDPPGGVDPNRNYPGNWSYRQTGGGPFPMSESEIRAQMDFFLSHPNIAASQHFHSTGGVLLRPPSVPDLELPEADTRLYMEVASRGLEVTGYWLATSVYDWNWPQGTPNTRRGQIWRDAEGRIRGWDDFPARRAAASGGQAAGDEARPAFRAESSPLAGPDPSGEKHYPAYGGSIDAAYLLFGVLSFANEIYRMGEDLDGDGRVDEYEQLRHNDGSLGGQAFKNWTAFDHPELGPVEIGGWRKFGRNNPLAPELAEEIRRNVNFVLLQAEATPLLRIAELSVAPVSGDVWRVTASVRNTGYQPTELAISDRRGHAQPVRARLAASEGAEILTDAQLELGTIAGHGETSAEWLIRAPAGVVLDLAVWHRKGGRTTAREQVPAASTRR